MLKQFLSYMTDKGCSYATRKAYQLDLQQYLQFDSPEAYLHHLREQGVASSSINRKLSAVRCYVKFCKQDIEVPTVKKPLKQPKPIPDAEFNAFIEYVKTHASLRDKLIIFLLIDTAARPSEIILLLEDNVVKHPCYYEIRFKQKGGNEASDYIDESCLSYQYLEAYLKTHSSDTGTLFTNVRSPHAPLTYHAFRKLWKQNHNNKYTMHQIRHTILTKIANDPSLGLLYAQRKARHASVETTRANYVKVYDDEYRKRLSAFRSRECLS